MSNSLAEPTTLEDDSECGQQVQPERDYFNGSADSDDEIPSTNAAQEAELQDPLYPGAGTSFSDCLVAILTFIMAQIN